MNTNVLNIIEPSFIPIMSDHKKKSVKELIGLCKDLNIKGYSNKNKAELINLIEEAASSKKPDNKNQIILGDVETQS